MTALTISASLSSTIHHERALHCQNDGKRGFSVDSLELCGQRMGLPAQEPKIRQSTQLSLSTTLSFLVARSTSSHFSTYSIPTGCCPFSQPVTNLPSSRTGNIHRDKPAATKNTPKKPALARAESNWRSVELDTGSQGRASPSSIAHLIS